MTYEPYEIDLGSLRDGRGELAKMMPGPKFRATRNILVELVELADPERLDMINAASWLALTDPLFPLDPRIARGPVTVYATLRQIAGAALYNPRTVGYALPELQRRGLVSDRAPGVVVLNGAWLHDLAAAGVAE